MSVRAIVILRDKEVALKVKLKVGCSLDKLCFCCFMSYVVITSVGRVGLVFGMPGDVRDKAEEDVRYPGIEGNRCRINRGRVTVSRGNRVRARTG